MGTLAVPVFTRVPEGSLRRNLALSPLARENMGKRGPIAKHRKQLKPPRGLRGEKTLQAWRFNSSRSQAAMSGYRKGYTYMWRCDPHYLDSLYVPRPGKYKENQHGGHMPALPHECAWATESRVRRIVNRCGHCGLVTLHELKTVRKMFSYLYQIQGKGGKTKNFKCISSCFRDMNGLLLKPSWKQNTPINFPKPSDLRLAFTTPWTAACGVALVRWNQLLLAAYGMFFNGQRPNCDMSSVKADSETLKEAQSRHMADEDEGWSSTGYHGGRNKLQGLGLPLQGGQAHEPAGGSRSHVWAGRQPQGRHS